MRPRLNYLKTATSTMGSTQILEYNPQQAKIDKLNNLFKKPETP